MLPNQMMRCLLRHGRISSQRMLATSAVSRTAVNTVPSNHCQVLPTDMAESFPRLGNRDIVGYGLNGNPEYFDMECTPFPAIRFKENTPEVLALREKEKGDWNNLTLEEKKAIYRANYCQTFSEFHAPTGEWRSILAGVFMGLAVTGWLLIFLKKFVYPPLPETITKEWQEKQVERHIQMRYGHIDGVASKWDYEKGQWKD